MLKQNSFFRSVIGVTVTVLFGLLLSGQDALGVESDVSYTARAQINVTVNSQTVVMTIESGSRAESVQVSAGSMTVQVGTGGDTFTVMDITHSPPYKFLINSAYSPETNCAGSVSTVILSNTATTTYTIAPGDKCSQSASSGGGGGGGGGGATPPPATQQPATPATAQPPAGAHPNGTLILDENTGTIFLVVNGKKRGFRNPEEYFSHGYEFSQAVSANATDLSLSNDSEPIEKALNGTLALDKTDQRTIYMIAGGQKRGFTSAEVFFALGYKFAQAVPIDLSDYPAGEPITTGAAAHPNGALVLDKNDNRTVWWVLNGKRQGFQSAEVFFTHGFSFEMIVSATDADMALSESAVVKFRDGTLVKDGENYYLVSDGKKRQFASTSSLENLGYKISNALSASLSAYEAGAVIE